MSQRAEDPRTLGRAATMTIVGVALAVVIAFLGYRATLGEHEVYAAQPAREMLDGGNWLLQPFAGAFRTKKPPGQSWLIAASMLATRSTNEYAARLPSALSAAGLALLLATIGTRLAGRRVGLVAGLMTLTCYAVQVRARLAEADMALSLAVALSYAGVIRAILRDRARFADGLLFWFALAFAFLLKGPIALGLVGLPIAAFLVIASLPHADDRLRAARRATAGALLNPIGIVVGVALIVGWPIGALLTYPPAIDQWRHEMFDRVAGGIRRDPIVAYLGFLPLATLPWTPFAIVALAAGWGGWRARLRRDPVALLLVLWTLVGTAMLTLIAFKRMHYALPIVAPMLLASALGFDRAIEWSARRFGVRGRERLAAVSVVGWFGVVGAIWIANQVFVEPSKGGSPTRDFAAAVNAAAPAGETIWLVGVGEDRTVYYLRPPVAQARLRDDESLDVQLARLPAGTASLVLCRLPTVAALSARSATPVAAIVASRPYREQRDDERRALIRLTPTTQAGAPATTAPSGS